MRIAVWHNLQSGGALRALHDQLKALKQRGHVLEIWTSDYSDSEFLSLDTFGKVHRLPLKEKLRQTGVDFRSESSPKRLEKLITVLKDFQKRCAEEMQRGVFDCAFVNSCSVTYMPYISEFLGIKSFLYLGEPYRWFHEA